MIIFYPPLAPCMRGHLIRSLFLENFLSYGPTRINVELLPMNVLIGPNASGKSNLLEALSIFRGTATDLGLAIREGGGISEYRWKGQAANSGIMIGAGVFDFDDLFPSTIVHSIQINEVQNRMRV
ncbi:MAG TPA: AAA family ATPase, partial [Longimicrobium sp.]|nr:AAA family ATPase [Longimicrobium sp.]